MSDERSEEFWFISGGISLISHHSPVLVVPFIQKVPKGKDIFDRFLKKNDMKEKMLLKNNSRFESIF